jgi:hypothetical protein
MKDQKDQKPKDDTELYFQECWKKGKPFLLTACRVSKKMVKDYGFKRDYADGAEYFCIEKPRTDEALKRFTDSLESNGVQIKIAPYVDANEFGWKPKSNFVLGLISLSQAERMATKLIETHHKHLLAANIGYFKLDKDAPELNNGGRKLAFVRRVSGNLQYFSNFNFMICFYGDAWDVMDKNQRRAVVDHELCHCKIEDGEWTLVEHDIEDFNEIVDRHGGVLKGIVTQLADAQAKDLDDANNSKRKGVSNRDKGR